MTFPADYDTLTRVTADDYLDTAGKEGDVILDQIQDAIEATQAAIGKTGETAAGTVEARLAAIPAAIAGAVTAHEVAADPHGQYTTAAEVASLAPAETTATIGALIAGATAKATPADADLVGLSDSASGWILKWLSWINLLRGVAAFLRTGGLINAATTSTPKIVVNSVDSITDSSADQTVLITCASSQGSKIGAQSKPSGAAGSNSDPAAGSDSERGLPWSNDTAYPNNGIAHVSVVLGGYDHVCNQEAGTVIGGGHNYLQYNASGHGTIVGGSNNRNAGARGAIVGGLNSTISAAATYAGVLAGSGACVSASWAVVLGSENAIIKSGADGAAILAGKGHSIGTNAYYSAIVAAQNGTIQDAHSYAMIMGRAPKSECSGAVTIGVRPLAWNGDCQASTVTSGVRTTNATITSLMPAEAAWSLGSSVCAVSIVAQVVGVDEATGNSVMFTWSGVAKWNGSTTSGISDAGGTSVSSRTMTQVVDGIGCAAVAVVAVDTGTPRFRVTGKAATNIKWCGRMDVCAVRV